MTKQIIEENYKPEHLYHDYTMLQANYPGDFHIIHSDNSKKENNIWVPNHTPHRTFSAGLYLNNDFEGGELEFPINNVKLQIVNGLLVVFPSNENYLHQVNKIISGVRFSILMWFTSDKNKEELHI